MKNTILLRRKLHVSIENGNSFLSNTYLATAMKNIERLGFTFSKGVLEAVRTLSIEDFTLFYNLLESELRVMVGDHVEYKPTYPNFPKQVMELNEADLYINAIIHYYDSFIRDVAGIVSTDRSLPDYEEIARPSLNHFPELKVIHLGNEVELQRIISQLIAANSSISQLDKEDIEWAIKTYEKDKLFTTIIPQAIPMKENLSFVVATLHKYEKASLRDLTPMFKTATDVLRLAVALSEGDVSLASTTKFKKFKRSERRLLLGLLESLPYITEDMLRNKTKWIRLGEILHPGEYKNKYPNTYKAFNILRNKLEFSTFESKLQAAINNKDITKCVALLSKRPGEFARRLDQILRLSSLNKQSDMTNDILHAFSLKAEQIATPVLMQVMVHFMNRHRKKVSRVFFPKGQVGKAILIENNLDTIHFNLCYSIVAICENALKERFSKLPQLGKVAIEENMKEQLIPFSQRSASKSLRTLVRGSKIELPEGDTIRFFTWWKEGTKDGEHTGRIDIDLSAVMYDKDWDYLEHISYTNLRSADYKATHSGDITSAPKGACEFIDLHIPSILKYGGRYIVAQLYSFTEQPFVSISECFAGWMMRSEPNSGEIFEPNTVSDKIDLSSNTTISIPVIIDLHERKMIWCDLALKNHPFFYNNLEGNQTGIIAMGKAMTSIVKPTLYDLFLLHAIARGELVESREEADVVFAFDGTISPFDTEMIISEFLV
ncbi:TerD family protein [Bacillus sp. JJ722]|uniref:TerD family protein n=1 Tax=Bacillus sp. JJ722 TaxID=3122973 RepID=UPI003000C6ED